MIYKQNLDNIGFGDLMQCPECGNRMVKNGMRELKYRGKQQNFCAGVVGSLLARTGRE